MISIKFHETVVACCDVELIGKSFEEDKLALNVSEIFYKGELFDEESAIKVMGEAKNLSLVGENTIGLALREGFINEEDVIYIQGVPHVQIYLCE